MLPRTRARRLGIGAALALVVLLAASATAAPPEGYALTLEPEPVPADAPFKVTFAATDGQALAGGVLKVCHSEDERATLCLLPKEMTVTGDGRLVGESEALPPDQEFGVNLTVKRADGSTFAYPGNGDEYVFFRTAEATRATPAAGVVTMGVALAVAASLVALRRRA